MIRVQQALEKLGYLWRILNMGLSSQGNFVLFKTSNYSKTPHTHTKPLLTTTMLLLLFQGVIFFLKMTLCSTFLLLNSEGAVNTKGLFSQCKSSTCVPAAPQRRVHCALPNPWHHAPPQLAPADCINF